MKTHHLLVAAAFLLFSLSAAPGQAQERRYGAPGIFEAGGTVDFHSGTVTYQNATDNTDSVGLHPFLGYFVQRAVEVGGVLDFSAETHTAGTTRSSNTYGLYGLIGFFPPVGHGGLTVGPELELGYLNTSSSTSGPGSATTTTNQSGPAYLVGILAKAPVGNSALVDIGVDYSGRMFTGTGGAYDTGNVDLTAGLSFFF